MSLPIVSDVPHKPEPEITDLQRHRLNSLKSLTGLRFFASILVVFYHYQAFFPIEYPTVVKAIIGHGNTGVSLFFILSGFILTFKYFEWFKENLRGYRKFIWARITRVFPMHFVALLIITPISLYFLLTANKFISLGVNNAITPQTLTVSWINNLLLSNVVFMDGLRIWNNPSWSLSCEIIFYIAFPFFVRFALAKISPKINLLIVASMIFVFQALLFYFYYGFLLLNADYLKDSFNITGALYSSPFLRIGEFLIGCVIGLFYLKTSVSITTKFCLWRNAILFLAFIIIFIGFCWEPDTRWDLFSRIFGPTELYLFFVPSFAVIILTTSFGSTFLNWILNRKFIILLGEASFSLYLIHWPVMLLVSNFLNLEMTNNLSQILTAYFAIGLSIALSILFYKKVEIPARRKLRIIY